MKFCAVLLAALALWCAPAWGQTSTTFAPGGSISSSAVNSAFGAKADVTGATLTTPNLASLKAFPTVAGYAVRRLGYTIAGDEGAATYNWSSSACSFNSGAGDNGAQVKPTSGLGCWIADFSGTQPTPMMWGANGVYGADDTSAVQAALNAMAGKTLYSGFHTYKITSTLVVPVGTKFLGSSAAGRSTPRSALSLGVPNINLIQMSNSTQLANMSLDSANSTIGNSTSGSMIYAPGTTGDVFIDDVNVFGGCIQFDISGNTQRINNSQGNGAGQGSTSGCGGIRIGHTTTHAGTVDPRITNTTIATTTSADYDLLVEDAGGLFEENNDFLFAKMGTKFVPGTNQEIDWPFLTNTVIGDTNGVAAFFVDTGDTTGGVKGAQINASWASSALSGGFNIHLLNDHGGSVRGIQFNGLRSYNADGNAIVIEANVLDTTIDASHICGFGNGQTGIYVQSNTSNGAIRNTKVGGGCDGFSTTGTTGITFVGNNTGWIVTDNDLSTNTVSLNQAPISDSVVRGNRGVDTNITVIASAATINLTNGTPYPTYTVSGTTTITAIIGASWFGRKVTLVPQNALTITAGPTICNGYSGVALVPIDLTYMGSCWAAK